MKTKLALLASALGVLAVAPVWAGTIDFNFANCGSIVSSSTCPGDLGGGPQIITDSTGTYAVLAAGFTESGNSIDLFVKDDGAGETGLGLAGTVDNEINNGQAIFMDMTDLADNGFDSGTFTFGSLQTNEVGWVCNLVSISTCQSAVGSGATATGTADATWSVSNPYLIFTQLQVSGGGNFLVDSLTAQNGSVPEPDSGILFVFGLLGIVATLVYRARELKR
jgi:hypothetical protein